MKIEDIKPGMIIVTRAGGVYIVHETNPTNDWGDGAVVGIRKSGWISVKFKGSSCQDYDTVAVYKVNMFHGLVGLYRTMSDVRVPLAPDEESLALLENTTHFEKIYQAPKRMTRSEIVNKLGFEFEIIEEE
jgi:hypothetical protein